MEKTLVMALSVGNDIIETHRGFPASGQLALSTPIKWYEVFYMGDSGFKRINETTTLGERQEELFARRRLFDEGGERPFEVRYGLVETSQLVTVYAGGEKEEENGDRAW